MKYQHLNGRPLIEELENLRRFMEQPTLPFLNLSQLHAAPSRPSNGMTVYADGTDWNPGSGQGVYTYYSSTWNKLG